LELFQASGYDDLFSLYLQTYSTLNPLTDKILQEIGLTKVGHRHRILSQLRQDALHFFTKVLNFDAKPGTPPIPEPADPSLVTSSVVLFPPSDRNERRIMSRNVLQGKKEVNGALFTKYSASVDVPVEH
jgi:hypothetical protein